MWIEKQKNGKFKFVERYEDPLTGKWKKVSITYNNESNATKKEAFKVLTEKIDERLSASAAIKEIPFSELIDKCLDSSEKHAKESYIATMRYSAVSIKNDIGDVLTSRITPVIINDLLLKYAKIFSKGAIDTKMSVICQSIQFGLDYGYVSDYTLLNQLKKPRFKTKKLDWKYLEEEEFQHIVDFFKDDKNDHILRMILILVGTGLRFGELVSIDYTKDIDFENNALLVRRTYNPNLKKFDTPKSGEARLAYFNEETAKVIKEQILYVKKMKVRLNLSRDVNLLCMSNHGMPYSNATFNVHLQKIDIPGKRLSSHIFRHTYITRMIENNVSTHLIAEQVGHADTKMIDDVYKHFSEKMHKQLSDAINNVTFYDFSSN